ncbi:dipeptidyl aminopeptidase [Copromyces sp. CBS 386.78]|nr:dipeptidyl aminopeptidase [Copromyces sp. CBS 386.78]
MAASTDQKIVAPYGQWESGITAEAVTAGSCNITSPRVCPRTGRTFTLQSRPDGSQTIHELRYYNEDVFMGTYDILEDYDGDGCQGNASTSLYEYGGLPYALWSGDQFKIIYSDARAKTVNVLISNDKERRWEQQVLFKSETHRYGDFDCHPGTPWVLAVEEDHTNPKPEDVKNSVVLIHIETGEVKSLRGSGQHDFVTYPRFNPTDMTQICHIHWDHPSMPFWGAKLSVMGLDLANSTVSDVKIVGGDDTSTAAEPRWGPDGQLYFGCDKSGFRQLWKYHKGDGEPILLPGWEDAEFGDAHWAVGAQSYVFLTDKEIVAAPVRFGEMEFVHVNLETGIATKLDLPLTNTSIRMDCLARLSENSVLAVASGYRTPAGVYRFNILPDLTLMSENLGSSLEYRFQLPEEVFSLPEHIRFTTMDEPRREVHGFLWLPSNPKYEGPKGTLPPLIIQPHGGPTAYNPPGLSMRVQYFTSRGYAFCFSNYTGSSAHGKAYREALRGEFGILDRDDVIETVRYLANSGRIDGSRVGIEGASSGGYCVLQCLTRYPDVFAGGISMCGVSDLSTLDEETHKLELHYLQTLLGLEGKSKEEKLELFRERSPLYHAQNIASPLLLIHGDADPVVPIGQSEDIKHAVERNGGDVKMVVLKGEGHMLKHADNLKLALRECEKWWRKTLLGIKN